MNNFFKLKQRGTTVKTELIAGMTTFFAMVYILMVNAGVAAGGRTVLTSLFAGAFFLVAMFLSPIAQLVPSCATAAALIYVGVLMMGAVRNIDWDDFKICVPAFLTVTVMPFTYNISYGIAFGLVSYIVISVFCGDLKKSEVVHG